jgi:hypothetical protein
MQEKRQEVGDRRVDREIGPETEGAKEEQQKRDRQTGVGREMWEGNRKREIFIE